MSGCIRFNKFNKYFKYILLSSFFNFFNACLIGFNHKEAFEKVSLNDFLYNKLDSKKDIDLSSFKITEFVWNFIGIFIFSLFIRLYELKVSGNTINNFFRFNYNVLEINKRNFLISVEQKDIKETKTNILHKFNNYLVHNSSILIYFIFALVWVAKDILMILFIAFVKNLDFWFLEILIVTIIFSNIFLVKIYKHQKLAIIINLFPCIFKIINIILSFHVKEKELYYFYPWWIPVGFICYLILIAINAFINCTIKSFIELKYITISQLLIFYSLVGIIICNLTCIISTYVPCVDNKIIFEKICKLKDDKYHYFDSFFIYFKCFNNEDSSGKFIRAFILILDAITFFLKEFFYISVIKFLDPVYITISQPIYFMLKKIVLIMNNLIKNSSFFEDTSDYKPTRFFLDIGGDFICLIGLFIYLEIIELNINNFNYDLRRNIIDRGILDDKAHLKMNESFVLDYEEEEEEDNGNSKSDNELNSYKSES